MNLVKASLRHPQVLYVLTAMTCLAGLAALQQMPRREDPKLTIRRGLVMAAYPGATAEQVGAWALLGLFIPAAMGGNIGSLMTFRDHGIVVVVLSNTGYADTFPLGVRIAEIFAAEAKKSTGK